jgi:hypothetical protein
MLRRKLTLTARSNKASRSLFHPAQFLGLGIFDEAANSFNFCENAGGIATIPGGPVGFLILEIADSAVQVGYFILDIAFFILEITGSAVLVGDFIIEIAGSGVSGGFYFC